MHAARIHAYIERLSNLLRNELRRNSGDSGLQPVQLDALHYLSMCNRFSDTPMGVTEYLGQTKGTVSQSLKVLERKGYLAKKPDKDDKRVAHLELTASGRRLVDRFAPFPALALALDSMDEAGREETESCLKQLLRGIQEASGSKSFGLCRSCRYNRHIGGEQFHCELVDAPLEARETMQICREHERKTS